MGNKKVLIIALVCGVAAVLLTNTYLNRIKASVTNQELVSVVVATKDIDMKTELTSEMVQIKQVPKQFVHAEAVTNLNRALKAVSVDRILAGEQVLKENLVTKGDTKEGLAYVVPKGMRAITVGVNQITGITDLLKPGDRVDLVGLMEVEQTKGDGSTEGVPMAKIMLQNIEVLAIGKNLTDKAPESKDGKTQEKAATTVILAVLPNDGEKVTLLNEKGTLRMMLRSPVDQDTATPQPYTPKNFNQ